MIAKGREPVARLVPIPPQPFEIGLLEGQLGHGPDFVAPMPESGARNREPRMIRDGAGYCPFLSGRTECLDFRFRCAAPE